jgi:hypothetical protein
MTTTRQNRSGLEVRLDSAPVHLYSVVEIDALGTRNIVRTFIKQNLAQREAELLQVTERAQEQGLIYSVEQHHLTT